MQKYSIEFPGTTYPAIVLEEGVPLTQYLTPDNSPVLFGCCNGICATCLVEVEGVEGGELAPPLEEEKETLEIYAENNPKARLMCQLKLTANIKVKKIMPE